MTPAGIYRKYKSRIRKTLESIKNVLQEAGHKVDGPLDMTDDEYRWSLIANDNVDITFAIAESEECDGSENGVNFTVSVVDHEGRILGGLTPYNYTSECWVDRKDSEAIEERFQVVEAADPYDLVGLLETATTETAR